MHFVAFASRLYFCFVVSITVSLAMSKAEFKSADVAISFFGYFLWKVLTILRRYITVKAGFQVFSFFR